MPKKLYVKNVILYVVKKVFITLSSGGKNPLSDSHKHNIGGIKWGKVLHKWDIKPQKGLCG